MTEHKERTKLARQRLEAYYTSASAWPGPVVDPSGSFSAAPVRRRAEVKKQLEQTKPDPNAPLFELPEEMGEHNDTKTSVWTWVILLLAGTVGASGILMAFGLWPL